MDNTDQFSFALCSHYGTFKMTDQVDNSGKLSLAIYTVYCCHYCAVGANWALQIRVDITTISQPSVIACQEDFNKAEQAFYVRGKMTDISEQCERSTIFSVDLH